MRERKARINVAQQDLLSKICNKQMFHILKNCHYYTVSEKHSGCESILQFQQSDNKLKRNKIKEKFEVILWQLIRRTDDVTTGPSRSNLEEIWHIQNDTL